MFENMNADVMLKMKKYGYLSFWAIMVPLVPFSAYVGVESGTQDYWAWFMYVFIFGVIPVLDYLIGKDPTNPSEDVQVPTMSEERFYRVSAIALSLIHI